MIVGLFGSYTRYIDKRRDYSGGLTDRYRWDLSSPAFSQDVRNRIAEAKKDADVESESKSKLKHIARREIIAPEPGLNSLQTLDYPGQESSSASGYTPSLTEAEKDARLNDLAWAGARGAALGALPGVVTAGVISHKYNVNFGKVLSALGSQIGLDAAVGGATGIFSEGAAQSTKDAGYVGKWTDKAPAAFNLALSLASTFGVGTGLPAGLDLIYGAVAPVLGDAIGDMLNAREVEALRDVMEDALDPVGKVAVAPHVLNIGTENDPYGTKATLMNLAAYGYRADKMLESYFGTPSLTTISDVLRAGDPQSDLSLLSTPESMANSLRAGYKIDERGVVKLDNALTGVTTPDTNQEGYFSAIDSLAELNPFNPKDAYDELSSVTMRAIDSIGDFTNSTMTSVVDSLGGVIDSIGSAVDSGWDAFLESMDMKPGEEWKLNLGDTTPAYDEPPPEATPTPDTPPPPDMSVPGDYGPVNVPNDPNNYDYYTIPEPTPATPQFDYYQPPEPWLN